MVDPAINAMMVAAKAFARRYVVPIIGETRRRVAVVGTGCLADLEGQPLLITAKHVMDEIKQAARLLKDDSPYGIPVEVSNGRDHKVETYTLGTRDEMLAESKTGLKDVDVGVIFLGDDFMRRFSARELLPLARHALSHTPDGNYFVYGHPNSHNEVNGDQIHSVPFCLATGLYDGSCEGIDDRYDRTVNLLLWYAQDAILCDESRAELPTPEQAKGLSGCPLWLVGDAPAGAMWDPSSCMKLVGIETAITRDMRCMVGTRWPVVLKAIHEHLAGKKPVT